MSGKGLARKFFILSDPQNDSDKKFGYVKDIVGHLYREFSIREIEDKLIDMSLHQNLSEAQIRRIFKHLNQFSDKKFKQSLRHARNVCLGIDEQKNNPKHSNRKVHRMLYELHGMSSSLDHVHLSYNHGLEAEGLFDIGVNIHHKVDDRLINISQTIEKSVSSFFGGHNISSLKNKLIRFILVIFECMSESSLGSKLRMLTSFLIDFEWTSCSLQEYANALAQVLQRPFKRNQEELEAQMDTEDMKMLIRGTMTILASMLALNPMRGDVKVHLTSAQKLSEISKSVKSVENIWKFVESLFGEALDNILHSFGLESPTRFIEKINSGVIPWMEAIDELPDTLDVKINSDYALALKVVNLKKQGDAFLSEFQRMHVPGTVMTMFMSKYNHVKEYAKKAAPHFFNDKMRESPFVVYLHGNSGIGKSTVQNFLVNELMQKMEIPFDHGRDIYVRNDNQDHWDGYHNQPVVFFDDFMQSMDNESRTSQLNEIIRVKNTTAYPLKMASLEDKGNTRFTSCLVVISSNLDFTANDSTLRACIECPTAIRRRIDVSARVCILKKYCDDQGKLDIKTLRDPTKRFDDSIYAFKVGSKAMNYPKFLEFCLKKWQNMTKQDKALIEDLPNWTGSSLESSFVDLDEVHTAALEAQAFFGRKEESNVLSEDELFLLNYAVEVDDEPVESWSQIMKDKFWELKKQIKDTSSDFYLKFKDEIVKFHQKFLEKYSWYDIGKSVVLALGTVGTIISAYHYFKKDKYDSEAVVSGDERTRVFRRQYKTRTSAEANVSGDQRTMLHSRKYIVKSAEANVSGDQRTMLHSRKYVTHDVKRAAEFDDDYRKDNVFLNRLEKFECEAAIDRKLYDNQLFKEDRSVEAQQSSDPCAYSLIGNLIYNNLAKVSCKGCSINGLFICDTILMVPRHMMLLIDDGDEFMVKTRTHTFYINIDECGCVEDDQMDVAFVRCPRRIGAYVSLLKHFHSLDELAKLNIDVGVLCGVRDTRDGSTMIMMMASNLKPRGRTEYPARIGSQVIEQCVVLKGYEYKSQTDKGDCGAPLIGLHTGLKKKIMGIHTAGSINLGVSNVLTQEYVEKQVAKFNEVIKPEMQLLNSDPLEAHSAVKEDDKVEIFGMIDKSLQFRNAGKTAVRESPLHGIFDVQTAPAMLKPEGDINPLRIAVKTQFVEQISFPQEAVDMAVEDLKCEFISYNSAYSGKGLLSDHAVLNGMVADPWIRPMNMKTSPGFPYINIKRTLGGKYDFLKGDVGNYSLDEFVQKNVDEREEKAKVGEIPMTLFCDALKDERRTLDKVQEGKTRVFNTAPFDLSYLVRKYFGNFIAHVMSNHVKGECSVGINPHSDEWTMLYEDLDNFAEKWIAGDFSKYDKTLSFQLICGALDVINAWYNDGHDFVRKTLFFTMFNASHLTGTTVYRVHQGNPSGIPLTVIINSLVNSLISRVTYTLISQSVGMRGDMVCFHRDVKVKNYGDDNLGKVSSQCLWYNMISIRDCLAAFGIKYTPPTKGEVLCEYLDEKDVSYLKRTFVKRGPRVWAPLDMTSIQEMLMWYREGPLSPEEAVKMTFESAMREMVHYGKKEFNDFQKYVTLEAARRELLLSAFSYDHLEKEMTEGFACDLDLLETGCIMD